MPVVRLQDHGQRQRQRAAVAELGNCRATTSTEGAGEMITTPGMRPVKPKALAPIVEQIPRELRELPNWVTWRYVLRDGEFTKVPCNPRGGNAKSNDSKTWGTFDEAAYVASRFDGIGFQFEGSPYVGIDLDDCRDPDSGELKAFARGILERFPTYAEISPSGAGVKLFVRGEWKDKGKRRDKGGDKIEVYGSGRYFAVTGHVVDGAPSKIADCQAELDASTRSCSPRRVRRAIRTAATATLHTSQLGTIGTA